MFFQIGSVRRDSEDESAFMAFSISMTTRMESETVDAGCAAAELKMEQSTSGNWVEQRWKCVCCSISH